jgi:hypothetical protein
LIRIDSKGNDLLLFGIRNGEQDLHPLNRPKSNFLSATIGPLKKHNPSWYSGYCKEEVNDFAGFFIKRYVEIEAFRGLEGYEDAM